MRCDRAKIFAPFSPLRGLDAAYREKERVIVPKAHLMTDRIEEIDSILKAIKIGFTVIITYYSDGEYKKKTGTVTAILPQNKLKISNVTIPFCDIYDIEILENER